MVVTSEVSIELGGQKDQESVTTRFGADAKEIVTSNFDVVALDGYFYAAIRGVDDFYADARWVTRLQTASDVFMTADVVPGSFPFAGRSAGIVDLTDDVRSLPRGDGHRCVHRNP